MKTIEIYANYGVLAAEKRNVYTFGAEHPHATCSDKMTVVVPDGWEIYQNEVWNTMVMTPTGWNYEINDVLGNVNGRPAFQVMDDCAGYEMEYTKKTLIIFIIARTMKGKGFSKLIFAKTPGAKSRGR